MSTARPSRRRNRTLILPGFFLEERARRVILAISQLSIAVGQIYEICPTDLQLSAKLFAIVLGVGQFFGKIAVDCGSLADCMYIICLQLFTSCLWLDFRGHKNGRFADFRVT